MALSFQEWTSPNIDFDSAASVSAFINDFDAKMVLAGLIKIPEESTGYTQPPNWPLVTVGQNAITQKLAYRLPKGEAKVEFEDVPGQTYKKIKRASFYKTDCEILITFRMLKASALNISLADPDYMKKTTTLYCDLGVRSNSFGLWNNLAAMGGFAQIGNTSQISTSALQLNRPNYIIHTEDQLSIFFAPIQYNGNAGTLFNNNNYPIVAFTVKRHQTKNSNFFNNFGSDRIDPSSAVSSHFVMTQLENNGVTTQLNALNILSAHTWGFEPADPVVGGETVMQPYIQLHGNIKSINSSMYVSRVVPDVITITENNAVVLYNGVPTIISTINLGRGSKQFSFGVWYFGTILMKPNYEVITGDLT